MEKRILIIDSDIILYRNAAVVDKRSVEVTSLKSGNKMMFDTRTDFKQFLKDKGFEYIPEYYTFEDKIEPGSLAVVHKLIDGTITKLQDLCWADEIAVYIGTEQSTFREHLLLPSKYKGNRSENISPTHLDAAKHYVRKRHKAICNEGIETDDSITIRAYEELALGNIPIIATNDKDAYQSQGVSIVNITDDPMFVHDIPEIGHVRKVKASVKGDGLLFLAFQVLFGDPTDHYKPSELSNIRYGAKAAMTALEGLTDPKDILEKVISEYKYLYPNEFFYRAWNGEEVESNWKHMLEIYWKCAYMKRSMTDQSNFWEYAARYGLNENDY